MIRITQHPHRKLKLIRVLAYGFRRIVRIGIDENEFESELAELLVQPPKLGRETI